MEIRNNTPSFGMALRKPQDMRKFLSAVNEFNIKDKQVVRGVKQVSNELSHHKNYDVQYNDVLDSFQVIEKSSGEIVKSFSNGDSVLPKSSYKNYVTAFDKATEKEKITVRDFWDATKQIAGLAKIKAVSPKEYLSRAFLAAANEADTLDKTSRLFS